jgi:hypothetical protein
VFIDLRERELLPQPVSLPLVARQIDRFRVQVGFVQSVQLLLNRFRSPLNIGGLAPDLVNPFAGEGKLRRCSICDYCCVVRMSRKSSTNTCAIASACRRIRSTS